MALPVRRSLQPLATLAMLGAAGLLAAPAAIASGPPTLTLARPEDQARFRVTTFASGLPYPTSLASLAVRGTLALFGASSGPVPPVDPQRLNAAGSVFLTRPNLAHFIRTPDEFAWRTGEFLDAIADGSVTVTVGGHYRLAEARRAHEDLEGRRTTGSIVLVP